ncbi:PTS sugar transporter subunit IIB [Spiroplasma alleghenense]|uniref:PTS system, cellobiose-specific IIB component n=1 Tax=Spiroplasma alleghenense TaxID=216931 RepID=A0A345Z4Y1_9MOLU|nr:PTS sugar transporter subunit IIB [Spiroplasma alleghenense]AXK51660.1 PTS system, cellobiose-specific IIB component [Spiroplasma alleghenense]
MKKILLCCSAGFSTSVLVEKMYNWFDDNDIDVRLEAVPLAQVKSIVTEWDMVLIAPQMAYAINEIKALTDKPVAAIPAAIYQNGSGKEVAELAMSLYK